MKLFFIHLLRSIKKWPLQPIVLVFTVAFSIAFCSSLISMRSSILNENERAVEVEYGSADFSVVVNSTSASRFMLAERANELLSEKGKAVGCFDLSLGTESEGIIFAYASDLFEVGEVFDLSFIAYGTLYESDLSDAIFLTRDLAERLSLSLGDQVTMDVFGTDRTYTVVGISADPLVGGREALVDIRSVTQALSKHSALVSALGESFLPSTTLFVDLAEGVSFSQGMEILSSDESFADKTFKDIDPIRNNSLTAITLNFVITAAVAMAAVVSAAVTFACFYILSIKRSGENETFLAAGTKPSFLQLMQFSEAGLYWILGAPIGVLLAWPLRLLFDLLVGFSYVRSVPSFASIFIALLCSLLAVFFSVLIFVKTRNYKKHTVNVNKVSLILLILSALSLLCSFLFDGKIRVFAGMGAIVFIVLFLVFSAPIAFKWLAARPFLLSDRKGRARSASFVYALKNCETVKVLHNTARLISLVVASVLVTVALVISSVGYSGLHEKMLRGDFVVSNPSARLLSQVSEDPSYACTRVYQQSGNFVSGHPVIVLASDKKEVFGEEMHIDALPEGDCVILSSTVAKFMSARVGDRLELMLEGKERSLKVSAIAASAFHFAVIDGEYNGLSYNLLVADAPQAEESAVYDALSAACAKEMSAVFDLEVLLAASADFLDFYLACGYIIAVALLIFAIVGLSDNLYESYKHRRADFALFSYAGADARSIRKMKRSEILYSIAFGLAFGLLLSVPALFAINQASYSLDYEFFRCIRTAFLL